MWEWKKEDSYFGTTYTLEHPWVVHPASIYKSNVESGFCVLIPIGPKEELYSSSKGLEELKKEVEDKIRQIYKSLYEQL